MRTCLGAVRIAVGSIPQGVEFDHVIVEKRMKRLFPGMIVEPRKVSNLISKVNGVERKTRNYLGCTYVRYGRVKRRNIPRVLLEAHRGE